MFITGAALAALLQCTSALRKGKSETTTIAGVRMMNYRYRHMQAQTAAMGDYDWIVKFKDGMKDEDLQEFCEGSCKMAGHPSHGGIPLATLRANEEDLESRLLRHPGMVEFVEPDSPVEVEPDMGTEDLTQRNMYNLEVINLDQAVYTGRGSHIYVMDTGIRTTHQDFGGRAVATVDTIAGGGSPVECAPGDATCAADDDGHGTHVAGTAGGNTFGVAREAVLHAMKVCCGTGTDINGGMDWIVQFAQKPAVMTMSLGSYTTPESSRVAVDAVVASGVTVTVSAGNRGTNSCEKSYTFIASALGVGSSTSTNERSGFSNYGTCNAIFAPGSSITSASSSSDTGSSVKSGTSMAAPLTAGAVALLLEEDPAITPAQVKSTLRARATAGALSGLLTGDPNLLLNVAEAYTGPPTPAPPTPAPPPPGTWELTGSGCQMSGNCISSSNYPSDYANNEACRVELFGDIPLAFEAFNTESGYDYLRVGGGSYAGTSGPAPGSYTGALSWATDGSVTQSGWKFCRTDAASLA